MGDFVPAQRGLHLLADAALADNREQDVAGAAWDEGRPGAGQRTATADVLDLLGGQAPLNHGAGVGMIVLGRRGEDHPFAGASAVMAVLAACKSTTSDLS